MIGDAARVEMAPRDLKRNLVARNEALYYCKDGTEIEGVHTAAAYSGLITYKPIWGGPKCKMGRDYAILTQVLIGTKRAGIRVSSYQDFLEKAELPKNKGLRFLLDWNALDENLFELARNNPYMQIPFTIDMYAYARFMAKFHGRDTNVFISDPEIAESEDFRQNAAKEREYKELLRNTSGSAKSRAERRAGIERRRDDNT